MRIIFIEKSINNLVVLQIPAFNASGLVRHGFSTRIGGFSQGDFDGLDLGLYNGDDVTLVRKNRLLFAETLGVDADLCVCPHQVHQTNIAVVTKNDGGKGFLSTDNSIEDTDGLLTDVPEVALMACFADCTPLFFLDPVRKAIGVSHAGWQGTVERIGAKTIAKMQAVFGSRPEDILVGIGPSIGACHYEVDQKVISRFETAFSFANVILKPKGEGKAWLDLWQANALQLIEAGVLAKNITISGYCTACRPDLFFSYRAQGGKTGRMAAMIALKA